VKQNKNQNLVRAGLCAEAADYYYSSASFYERGIDSFEMLRPYERPVMSYVSLRHVGFAGVKHTATAE
jgi:hypothetical protein